MLAYPLLRRALTLVPIFFRQVISKNLHVFWLGLLSVALSVGWFLLDGHINVNLSDEGFLWYGTYAMRHGQVPMRDFQAYDPGRYLWTAAWSYVFGDGLVAMRLACVLFQCLGVLAGLLAARRLSRNPFFLTAVALLFCAWMHPRFKLFEQSIALLSIHAGVLLLEKPTVRRHFAVGVFGGLMAFVGRNHGAYHVVAFGLLIAWAARAEGWRVWCQRGAAWVGGMLVGYLPQWLMLLCVPGYFSGFVENLRTILVKGTNLPAKVPWPWRVTESYSGWLRWSGVAEGCYYVAFPLFFLLVALRMWRLGGIRLANQPVLMAAVCVTLPYTHYVFSRPDIVHLSHAAPALALGIIALAWTMTNWIVGLRMVAAPLLAATGLLANLYQIGFALEILAEPNSMFPVEIRGQRLSVQTYFAKVLASARTLNTDLAKKDEPILFVPNLPGLYPFTGRLSPIEQIYFIYPATPEEDSALLAEINAAGVQWVMMHDYALDGREELRFRNTNPIVFTYLRENFELVSIPTLPRDMFVLHRTRRP